MLMGSNRKLKMKQLMKPKLKKTQKMTLNKLKRKLTLKKLKSKLVFKLPWTQKQKLQYWKFKLKLKSLSDLNEMENGWLNWVMSTRFTGTTNYCWSNSQSWGKYHISECCWLWKAWKRLFISMAVKDPYGLRLLVMGSDSYMKMIKSDAFEVFKEFEKSDVVLWTCMVSGYEQNSCFKVTKKN